VNALCAHLPRDRCGWLAVLVFLVLSAPLTFCARGERSGMIQMTRPTHDYTSSNLSIGFTNFLGEAPLFRENQPFLQLVELMNGLEAQPSFYFARPFYGFLAAQVAPFTGIMPALLLVNYAAFALCAWVTWRFALALFADRVAALVAVALLTGGMGMLAHIGDYSAHLLSFCTSYVGMLVLFESGVWREGRPLRTHVLIGLTFGVALLTYNSGLMLLAAYLAVAVRHNRLWHLAVAAALTLCGQRLWRALLTANGIVLPEVEESYLAFALEAWREILGLPALELVRRTVGLLTEFLVFDSPGVLVAGLIGLLVQVRGLPLAWLCAVLIAAPLGAGLVTATAAGARGYLVYQISLLFYCAAGGLFSRGLRAGGAARAATAAALVLVVAGHLAWSTAHLRGDDAPIATYFLGIDDGWPLFRHPSSVALSLTGAEPTPALFGGEARLAQAGLFVAASSQPVSGDEISWLRAAGLRLPFLLYLGALAGLLLPPAARRGLAAVLLGLALALPTAATLLTTERLAPVASQHAFAAPPFSRVRYRVELSDAFVAALHESLGPGDRLAFHFRPFLPSMALHLRVSAGTAPVGVRRTAATPRPAFRQFHVWLAERPEVAVRQLARAGEVTFELTNGPQAAALSAWQRADLVGRSVSVTTRTGEPARIRNARLPGLEIRLLRPDGTLELVGF
jgi:hypothetical protein